jgi:hypothetical protein
LNPKEHDAGKKKPKTNDFDKPKQKPDTVFRDMTDPTEERNSKESIRYRFSERLRKFRFSLSVPVLSE